MKSMLLTHLAHSIRVILGIVLAWHTVVQADTQNAAVPLNPALKPSPPAVAKSIVTLEQSMTLCEPKEVIVFSCSLPKRKIVSLCASKDAVNNVGYMQYRFGRGTSSIELEYPQKKAPPKEYFKYYTFAFAKGGTAAISFRNGQYRYSLFSTTSAFGYNGSGVILSRDNKRVSFSKCIGDPFIHDEMQSPIPFFGLQRLGLPDAGDDISYIGPEPNSDLNQPKPGEPENWLLRGKH